MSSMKPSEEAEAMAAPGIKAIIFDCFGVLYTDSKRSLLDIVPKDRYEELHDLFVGNNYGLFNRHEYISRVAEIVGISDAEVASYIAHEHVLNKELVELISRQLKGTYRIGLLSNIGRDWIEDFFTQHQLHSLFDAAVLSGEEGIAKPHPDVFALTASRLGVAAPECLMIDDIEANCEGAQMAGMQSIRFQSNRQLLEDLRGLQILEN